MIEATEWKAVRSMIREVARNARSIATNIPTPETKAFRVAVTEIEAAAIAAERSARRRGRKEGEPDAAEQLIAAIWNEAAAFVLAEVEAMRPLMAELTGVPAIHAAPAMIQ